MTPEQLNHAANTLHITTPSTPVPTQTTTTIQNLNTVIEQQDNKELAVRRGEEQEGRTEKQERAEQEADT
jgi:hypothetical protein